MKRIQNDDLTYIFKTIYDHLDIGKGVKAYITDLKNDIQATIGVGSEDIWGDDTYYKNMTLEQKEKLAEFIIKTLRVNKSDTESLVLQALNELMPNHILKSQDILNMMEK